MNHFGHPIGTLAPADATAAEMADWYREPHAPLPEAVETHLDPWLRRETLECERAVLLRQYEHADPRDRHDIEDAGREVRACIEDINRKLNTPARRAA